MNFFMKRIKTLKKNYEFKKVLSKGSFYVSKHIILYVKKNNKKANYVGFAVNTKIGKAVRRNRIKRIIRESYKLEKNNIDIGYDIVFLWNKNAKDDKIVKSQVIRVEMVELFNKANMV